MGDLGRPKAGRYWKSKTHPNKLSTIQYPSGSTQCHIIRYVGFGFLVGATLQHSVIPACWLNARNFARLVTGRAMRPEPHCIIDRAYGARSRCRKRSALLASDVLQAMVFPCSY